MNLSDTFEWNGTWTTAPGVADAPPILDHSPGWWNMTLSAVKTIEQGTERYAMTFSGAHNTGPTVTQPVGGVGARPVGTFDKSLTHGTAVDIWKIVVTPDKDNPQVINWSVTAKHVVPEPAAVAVVTAAGLLVFGMVRSRRKRIRSH